MNTCTHCGAEQPPHAQFCGSCGHFFSTLTDSSPSPSILSYVTIKSNPPYPVKQTNTSNAAYETVLDAAQPSQTPLPEQRAFDGTLLYGQQRKEEDEDEEHGALFLSPPVHNTPQIANVPPAPQVTPPINEHIQMQQMGVKQPLRQAKQLSPAHKLISPLPITPPHPIRHRAPRHTLRPYALIITLFLVALIILGTLLTLFFVTPPSLEISGSGTVSAGNALHLHGDWYTPESKVLLLLDETIPLSAYQAGTPTVSRGYTTTTLLTASSALEPGSTSGNTIVTSITGSFDATITVGADWKAGKHSIQAMEQGGTRSATTQIAVSTPSHLDSITPSSVTLGPITEGDSKLISTHVTLGAVGTNSVSWTASWDTTAAPWLQLDSISGMLQAPNTQDITLTANPQKLKAGTYKAAVTFTDTTGNNSFLLPVSLTIQPNKATNPTLSSINPNTLVFDTVTAGSTQPLTQPLTLSTAGKGAVQWQVAWNQQANTWLQLDRTGDTIHAPDSQQVLVSILPQGLTAGQYTATMTFTSSQSDTPLIVTIQVTVQGQADLNSINPQTVSLGPVTEGYTQPATAQVTLKTSGTGNVQWRAYWDKKANPWLQLDRTSDSIEAPTSETLVVGAIAGMKVGTYSAIISFTNLQNGNSMSLSVNFTVQAATAPGEISSVTPATVTLGPVTEGYQQSPTAQVTLNTSGTGTVQWNASFDNKQGFWLSLPASGQIQAPGTQSVTLSTVTGVKAGTYTVNVNFTNPQSNKTVMLAISFIVQAPPPTWGSVSPNPLTLATATQGYSQPVMAQATLSTTGSGTLSWTASSDANWLSVSNNSGQIQAPGTQTVTITAATGLQAGSYLGNITFTDTSSGKQLPLAVAFTVQPPPQLAINTNTLTVNTDCQARRAGWICFVTLTNSSTTDSLTWSSASTNSGTTSIVVIPTTYTLTAGQSQRVQISILIQQSGAFNDTVTFTGPGNSQTVTVRYSPPVIG